MTYVPPSKEELVTRVREATAKANTLHESSMRAHDEMKQASGQYEFLVTATRHAWEDVETARHAVKSHIERETWAATA